MKQEIIDELISATEEYGLPLTLDEVFGKNINVNIGFSQKACDKSIDDLFLSVRSQNALKRSDIFTIGELVNALTHGDLKQIRNLGAKSFREIQTKVLVYGYECLSEKSRREFFANLIELNMQ